MQRELHAHGRAHVLQAAGQGHHQRGRADAVAERLHAAGAGDPSDLGHGLGPVAAGDVVERERRPGRRQVGARPVVEQPDVVAGVHEVLGEVGLDGVDEERRRRHAEPGGEQHWAAPATLVADEAQPARAGAIVGLAPVALVPPAGAVAPARLGGRQAQPPVPGPREGDAARRGLGERRQVVEAAVGVGERAEEAGAEPGLPPQPLAEALDPRHPEGGELAGEVGRGDAHHATNEGRAGLVADRDEERGGVGPQVEPEPVVQHLVALEAEAPAVVGRQPHRVPHVPRVDVSRVLLREAERALLDPEPPGRQRRGDHGAAQPAGRGGVLDHCWQVADVDGQDELEPGAVGLALRRAALGVAVGLGPGPAGHALGEAQARDRGGGRGRQRRGRTGGDRPPLLGRQQLDRPFGEGRDGEQRVHRQGSRHDGAVGDEQPVVDVAALAGEHPAPMVDDAGGAVVAHGAPAERVDGDQCLAQHRRPQRVGDVLGRHGGRTGRAACRRCGRRWAGRPPPASRPARRRRRSSACRRPRRRSSRGTSATGRRARRWGPGRRRRSRRHAGRPAGRRPGGCHRRRCRRRPRRRRA